MVSIRRTFQYLRIAIVIGALVAGAVGPFSTQVFAQDAADLTTLSDGDISAYRWQAMAEFYAVQPAVSDLTTLSDGDISAYRWEAMAEFYTVQPAVSDLITLSDGDILAYRWEAMAEFYDGQPALAAMTTP